MKQGSEDKAGARHLIEVDGQEMLYLFREGKITECFLKASVRRPDVSQVLKNDSDLGNILDSSKAPVKRYKH